MSGELTHLRGVIFDWAGTTVDHGSRAPELALVELFRRRDIEVGIEAGRNAGCWTIGVTRAGNLVGLSAEEIVAMPEETSRRCAVAADRLRSVGAHYIVESAADVLPVLREIDARLRRGDLPSDDRVTSAQVSAR